MRKTLVCSVALATLTTLLAGCDQSTPTPEQAMEQEVLGILQDELPSDATAIDFAVKYGAQSCSVEFKNEDSGLVAMNQATNLVPIVYSAVKHAQKWETTDNQFNSATLEGSSGRVGSEALSASDFRNRVRTCLQLAQARHEQLYSQSTRAKNALSWAQAADERSKRPSWDFPGAIPALQATPDQQVQYPVPREAESPGRLNSGAIP